MTGRQSALRRFLALITATCPLQTFNPWVQIDTSTDRAGDAPAARLARLRAHLDCEARLLLIGEAAGYQGCHVSGVAFTSERLILEGRIPRVSAAERLTTRPRPWSEPSATTVWGALHEHGLAETTVLWNCFPWHPHRPGEPQSNRTPTRAECALGRPVLEALCGAFPAARVVAVGRAAQAALAALGREAPSLRHPSMGGAMAFRAGLAEWAGRGARQKGL
jgi:uracil-DNA glycosylase